MSNYRRRRFLTDLLFIGGALLAAAGLASTGEGDPGNTSTPLKTPEVTPSPATTCELPMPGGMAPPPPPPPTPKRQPARDPFKGPSKKKAASRKDPQKDRYPLPGEYGFR